MLRFLFLMALIFSLEFSTFAMEVNQEEPRTMKNSRDKLIHEFVQSDPLFCFQKHELAEIQLVSKENYLPPRKAKAAASSKGLTIYYEDEKTMDKLRAALSNGLIKNIKLKHCSIDHLKELLPYMGKVESLKLRKTHLSKADVLTVIQSPKLSNLTSLDLKCNGIGKEGALAIGQSLTLTKLKHLNLKGNDLGNLGTKAIVQSPNSNNFTSLILSSNRIGRKGALVIAQSPTCRNLIFLDLKSNNICKEEALAIVRSPTLSNLTSLDLSWNDICEEEVETIIQSRLSTQLNDLTVTPRIESWY